MVGSFETPALSPFKSLYVEKKTVYKGILLGKVSLWMPSWPKASHIVSGLIDGGSPGVLQTAFADIYAFTLYDNDFQRLGALREPSKTIWNRHDC